MSAVLRGVSVQLHAESMRSECSWNGEILCYIGERRGDGVMAVLWLCYGGVMAVLWLRYGGVMAV